MPDNLYPQRTNISTLRLSRACLLTRENRAARAILLFEKKKANIPNMSLQTSWPCPFHSDLSI